MPTLHPTQAGANALIAMAMATTKTASGAKSVAARAKSPMMTDDQEAEEVSDDRDRPPYGSQDRRMRTVDEMNAAHQSNMQRVYDSYARELSEAWKGGK